MELLEEYDFDIIHRPGSQHGNVNAMSRRHCNQCEMRDDSQIGNICATRTALSPLQDEWLGLCETFQFHMEYKSPSECLPHINSNAMGSVDGEKLDNVGTIQAIYR